MLIRPPTVAAGLTGEPSGDRLQRLAVRLAGVGLLGALLPAAGLHGGPLAWNAAAHSRAMAFGFIGVFVCGFLMRILPRARKGDLPWPRLAAAGLWLLAGTAILDAFSLEVRPLWLLGAAGVALPLGAAWRLPRKAPVWFEGWLLAGMLGMGTAVAGLLLGGEVALRAPSAFLLAGATPLTLGLAIRMLPPLSGIGPPDRVRAASAGRAAPALSLLAALGFLIGGPGRLAGLACVGLLWVSAALCLRWFRDREDGDEERKAARRELAPTVLRLGARGAVVCGGAGFLVAAEGWSAGVHLVGLGFLTAMAVGVAQRLVPGFVRGNVRWPRLQAVLWLLVLAALLLRMGGFVRGDLLGASALGLAAGWLFFAAQVAPNLHPPDPATPARRCGVAGATVE